MPYTSDKDKKKRKVQRLVDVEVTHVSLVDNPANRTPFRAIKRDKTATQGANPMNITLKNMFGSRPAGVTSVMADTKHKAVAIAKALMEGSTAEVTEQDGVFIARKSGTDGKDERVIHMGDALGIAYTVSGSSKFSKTLELYDGESMDFGETVQKEGFVPGLYTATEALHTTIRNIALDEGTKSPADFNSKVSKALDAFGKYVSGLIEALPEQAFKFEKAALTVISPSALKPIRPEADGFNAEVYDAIFGETEDEKEKDAAQADGEPETPEATSEDDDAKAGVTSETEDDAAAGEASDADPEADAAPANLEELPKETPTERATHEQVLAEALESLTKNIGKQIAEAVAPISERLDAQEASMQKVSKAIGGAVAATPEADDDNVVQLSKGTEPSYGAEGPPLMDTAYRTTKRG